MRGNPFIASGNINFKLDEYSAGHACFNGESISAIGRVIEIENRISDNKIKEVLGIKRYKILEKSLEGLGIGRSLTGPDTTQITFERDIYILGCSCIIDPKFESVPAFDYQVFRATGK